MRVKIYKDEHSEMAYNQNVQRKAKLFKELVDYCSQHIDTSDLSALSEKGLTHFKEVFYNRYKDSFPPTLSIDKMLELSDISASKIDSIHQRYSDIQIDGFDVTTATAPELDFNVYATTKEQIKRFELAQSICHAVNELKAETNYTFFLGQISQGCSGVVQVSFADTTKLVVNPQFVLTEN